MPAKLIYTKEQLLDLLKRKAEEFGRTPTKMEIKADKGMPSTETYVKRFGSYNNAVKAAGLDTNFERHKPYTEKELVEILKNKAKELGRTPTMEDLNTDKDMPSPVTYFTHFGSYNKALKAAELDTSHENVTDEELIEALKKKAKELGRAPNMREIDADENMPSSTTYREHFGSYNAVLETVNLAPNQGGRKPYRKEELIDMLRKKAEELGRTPTIEDVDADNDMLTASTFHEYFGSYNKALKAAELDINVEHYTDEELLEMLKKKADELGRTPVTRDLNTAENIPNSATYQNHFGSWNAALKKAGLEPNWVVKRKKRTLKKKLLDERL